MRNNLWKVFLAKTIRTFSYGFMGVLLPISLAQYGFTKKEVGVTFSLTLITSAFVTWAITRPIRRYGIRKVLIALHGITVLSASLFLVGNRAWVLVLAAMIGNLAVGVGETGPFLALEQVVLARAVSSDRITGILSIYNLLGYICAAVGGAVVAQMSGHPKILFAIFMASGATQSLIYVFAHETPVSMKSRKSVGPVDPFIRKITSLFAIDAFAGGFILQSWVVYWFYLRFGLDLPSLGWIYFSLQAATGLSLLIATPLSKRWGLVNTMVFSHLLSNLLLLAVAAAPGIKVALLFLIARHLLSQIDVPTRQSFLMLAVSDEEREYASTLTTTCRTFSQSISPSMTGWLMQAVSLSFPFVVGGSLKIVYDILLYRMARRSPLIEAKH